MKTVTQKGYAKINLHLDITGRTNDGYHLVETVMQSISLCDDITLTKRNDGKFTVSCNVDGVPTDERNLAVKAALLFCEKTGLNIGADIVIYKRIPMAAGMAGGSADAAAVLRAMNELSDNVLSEEELCALGARLGADVPFCVVCGSAYADGKGDKLHAFPTMPDCYIVAACGGEGVSTPWAYETLDGMYNGFYENSGYSPRGIAALSEAVKDGNIDSVAKAMYNIFEEPILTVRPVAKEIRDIMRDNGSVGAMMSGSGPSVFGIFTDKKTAEQTAEQIDKKGYFATVCRPITKN